MRHSCRFSEPSVSGNSPISARRRRWLRWVFAVIFGAGIVGAPLMARDVPFSDQLVISTSGDFPRSLFAVDVDGDGDLDVVAVSVIDDKIAWYENTDGAGTFGVEQVIGTGANGPRSVVGADLDGDGDNDVVVASQIDDTIGWYENTDGAGTFGMEQVITSEAEVARAVFVADVDGDGDADVLSASLGDSPAITTDSKIAWYENTDGAGTFGAQQVISILANGAESVSAADVDGDGDLDVLSASRYDDEIAWYENTDGAGTFGAQQVISSAAEFARWVVAADVDGDGDLDVLSASQTDDKIAWYENTDGAGTFGGQQIITTLADAARTVFAADLDGDGDVDALSASVADDEVAWYENTDGAGTFGPQQLITTIANGASTVVVADVDGDGDGDVLSTSRLDDKVAWYQNETIHRSAAFPEQSGITSAADGARSVFAADVDGDGDSDALSASYEDDTIAWYENADGAGTFGAGQTITSSADGATSVFAADVDGDGDVDALSASYNDDTIAWYENTDGAGSFGAGTLGVDGTITTAADGAEAVVAADVDGDGDMDVLSASSLDDTIAWYENTDGAGSFGGEQEISGTADGARSVFAADVDGDGDTDALSASYEDDTIAWYANTDGLGTFGAQQVITAAADGARSVFAADVDGDGDLDALSASYIDDTIAWYENTDGAGTFGAQQVISSTADGAASVLAADVDVDGDQDVVSASQYGDSLTWYENTDGAGTFGSGQEITSMTDGARSVFAADVDRDGAPDVLSASSEDDTIAWYDNKGGQFSLATTDVAQGVISNGQLEDLLSIEVSHAGRDGDSPVELTSLELRFTDGMGTALTEAQALALVQTVRLFVDDGSGGFDGADAEVGSTSDFSSITTNGDGVLTFALPDDDPNLQVAFGTPKTYFLAAEMTADAQSQVPGSLDVEHRTETSSTGEDATEDIPLILEFAFNVKSGVIDTQLSTDTCQAPFDLNLEDRTVSTMVTCQAGTVLSAGDNFILVSPGVLSFQAGQSIELEDGFEIEGGDFDAEIDPNLEP